jgi:PAS domain-containing protein
LVLIFAAGILTLRTQGPWRSIYVQLLGASTLYALSSAVANLAIDSGGYVNGKLYGLGLTASVCWFVWIPLQARQLSRAEITTADSDSSDGLRSSVWAMVVVVIISIPIVWELLERSENSGLRTLRLLVSVATIVFLASAAYITEYFARRKLASDVDLANEALRASEELLKVFVKNVPAAVAMLDRDMRYLQVSDRWCSDYLPGRAQVLGRSHYEIFPDVPDRWKEVHRRALQGETLRADEDRWDGQNGTHWAR